MGHWGLINSDVMGHWSVIKCNKVTNVISLNFDSTRATWFACDKKKKKKKERKTGLRKYWETKGEKHRWQITFIIEARVLYRLKRRDFEPGFD